jgi:heat-inducible transcriptional repressor
MSDLEEMNYITHPHTSAGRVPTDKGYRFYVDSLNKLSRLSRGEYQSLSDAVSIAKEAPEGLQRAGKVLGAISKYLTVVRMPQIDDAIIERIELVHLSSQKILVVIQLDSDIVSTVTLEADFEIEKPDLDNTSVLLNERIAGRTLSFVKKHFNDIVGNADTEMPLIRIFTESVEKIFMASVGEQEIVTAGVSDMLTHPEFEDVSKIRGVIELVENRDAIVHLIDQSEISDGKPSVIIGSESGNTELEDYSVVMSRYRLSNGSGAIGLIGPKRMDYSRMLSIMKAVTDLIEK